MLDDAWWTLRTIFISIYPTNPGWQRSQRTMNGNLDKQKRFRWNQSPTIANINKTKLIRWFKSRTIWCCSPIRQYGTRFRSTHTLWYINKTERWIKIITQRSLWFKKRERTAAQIQTVFSLWFILWKQLPCTESVPTLYRCWLFSIESIFFWIFGGKSSERVLNLKYFKFF